MAVRWPCWLIVILIGLGGCYKVGGLDTERGPNLAWLGPLYMAHKWTPGFIFLTFRLHYSYKTLS